MTSAAAGCLALLVSMAAAPPKPELVTLSGKVVELSAALKSSGFAFDAEPIAKQVVLVGQDQSLTPLLSDDASRAFFLDERLRNRQAELKARRIPGVPYIQVVSFRVIDEGTLRTPEYFCEICTISVRWPQICPCCQGPLVLRMKPDSR